MAPPAFLLPAVIGAGSAVLSPKLAQDRQLFLAGTVGAGAAALLLFALPLGQLSLPYLLITVATAAFSLAHIQLVLAGVQEQTAIQVAVV